MPFEIDSHTLLVIPNKDSKAIHTVSLDEPVPRTQSTSVHATFGVFKSYIRSLKPVAQQPG